VALARRGSLLRLTSLDTIAPTNWRFGGAGCGEIAGLEAAEIDRSTWLWDIGLLSARKNGRARVTPPRLLAHARPHHRSKDPTETDRSLVFASEGGQSADSLSHRQRALLASVGKSCRFAPFTNT